MIWGTDPPDPDACEDTPAERELPLLLRPVGVIRLTPAGIAAACTCLTTASGHHDPAACARFWGDVELLCGCGEHGGAPS